MTSNPVTPSVASTASAPETGAKGDAAAPGSTSASTPVSAARGRRRRQRRWLLLVLLLVVLGAGGYWVKARWFTTAAPEVATSPVTRGDIEVDVLATGELRPETLVAVGAQVSGRITALKVKVGDTVKAGDLIAEIDSKTQENAVRTSAAQLAQVQAQLKEQEANVAYAEGALARQANTRAANASTQAAYDSAVQALAVARASAEALKAAITSAEVGVETAKVNLGYTRITAPISGTVLAVVAQAGQTVNASSSTPTIVVLGQLDRMKVQTEISEADVARVKPGMPVYFSTLGSPGTRYDAVLQSIDPAPESITSDAQIKGSSSTSTSSSSSSSTAIYYYGWFEVPNPKGVLRTYMTAEVHIVLGRAKGVLTIPSGAVGTKNADGTRQVRVEEAGGKIVTRDVKIGLDNKIRAEVLSGLSEGERVVTGEVAATKAANSSQGGMHPPGL